MKMMKPTLQNKLNNKIEDQNSEGMRHKEDPLPSGMKEIIMKETKEELDHTKGELLLTTKKLKKFEKRTENLDEILSSQRSLNDKT